jgi:hypothetical protein
MADNDTEATIDESEGESIEINEECLEHLREIARLGHEKDINGRRGAIKSSDPLSPGSSSYPHN